MIFKPTSRHQFWTDERYWPREGVVNGLQTVFLARAFNRVGQHLFPDAWTGEEGHAEIVEPLPASQSLASDHLVRFVHALLTGEHPGYRGLVPLPDMSGKIGGLGGLGGTPGLPALLSPPMPYQPFYDDDWDVAARLFAAEIARRQPAINRRASIAEWFAVHINDEQSLQVILVNPRTADYGRGPPHHWNARWIELENRWPRGSYNYDEPFAAADAQLPGREVNIFVSKADLDRLLGEGEETSLQLEDNTLAAQEEPSLQAEQEVRPGRRGADETKPGIALQALTALYPDGRILVNVPERDDAVNAWVEEHHPKFGKIATRSITKAVGEFRRSLQGPRPE